ncbi:o-succinylbenzoate--CoA ligase [Pueribacillus sp. YX66]|uniref:o-succinylbenzoate--CoA ligase n=1 Tax=Pueribacillus sp. YX66 TaxID=3229242 RepID=UPI00358D98C6
MHERMPNWLYKRANLTPDRIAIEFEGEHISFFQLHLRATSLARKLASFQIKSGDSVAFLLENGIHTVEIIHALEYLGATIVPLNSRLTASELHYQLHDSNPKVLIYDDSFANNALEACDKLKTRALRFQDVASMDELETTIRTEIHLDEHHTIMYTSGTTGSPKGVILTYGNHWWSAIGSSLNLGLHENDKWLCAVPMFHMSGLSIVIRSVIYGIPIVIQKRFQPEKVNEAIVNDSVTIVSVVSAMLSQILQRQTNNYPKSFRCMLLGGGPAPLPLLEKCTERKIPVYQTYGMTETASQIVTLSSEYMLKKIGSAGKPLFHSNIKIENNGVLTPPNEVGEIIVRGPTVTKGYLHRNEETKKTIKNGWLYTGDLGYLDEDGFLYVIDRRSDLIISGGENVYPAEIEATLLSHPKVVDAGVTRISDKTWGQVPIAFVVTTSEVTEQQLLNFCKEKLARYKLPKRIYFAHKLPRNGANKLLRRELIHLIDEGRNR